MVPERAKDGAVSEEPQMSEQVAHWNAWVEESKAWESNRDNLRRGKHALENVKLAIARLETKPKILDVACGSGWLSRELSSLGEVTALDLADQVIAGLRAQYPHINWLAGDFLEMPIEGQYDVVTCLEALSSVSDQLGFAKRLADLTKSGGTLVLTTHNPFVWNRTSWLTERGKGQIRKWVPKKRLLELFSPYFKLKKLTTCAPSGDRGVVKLFNNRISAKVGSRLIGTETWMRVRERCGLGCSFVYVATRR
jgi:2-polyprenyl-3-methyl-5-hydroxy-6-metoxy-1,4-benzoquinol methylase